jgi:hypothetical protein
MPMILAGVNMMPVPGSRARRHGPSRDRAAGAASPARARATVSGSRAARQPDRMRRTKPKGPLAAAAAAAAAVSSLSLVTLRRRGSLTRSGGHGARVTSPLAAGTGPGSEPELEIPGPGS